MSAVRPGVHTISQAIAAFRGVSSLLSSWKREAAESLSREGTSQGPQGTPSLRWPNTVFARALADAIQRAHKDCKNKHAVDTAIILFAQFPLYLCYFSS